VIDESALHSWIRLLLVSIVVLVEQDVELGQLRQTLEQLREEKEKETGRASKLAEELNGEYFLVGITAEITFLLDESFIMLADYRRRVKAQFDVLEQDARTQRVKFDAIVAGVKPVLDCIKPEVAPQPDGKPPSLNIVIERCKMAWDSFKGFNRDTVVTAATHALAMVRSHYPTTDL